MKTYRPIKVIVCLVAIFLLGSAAGAMLMHVLNQRAASHQPLERDWAERELHTLQKRLQLRPDQVTALRPAFAETANAMRQVRLDTVRQLAELIRRNSAQVALQLDTEQKKFFDTLIQERQAQRVWLQEPGERQEKKSVTLP